MSRGGDPRRPKWSYNPPLPTRPLLFKDLASRAKVSPKQRRLDSQARQRAHQQGQRVAW